MLSIDNPHFKQMIGQIYATELQLNETNSFETGAPYWTCTNGTGSFEIYDERNDFYHEIVNSPFYDGDVPCPLSNRVYIS